ncbi:MAG TPA: MFS transporter [Thermoanaerobaculia bacterium]|nr:MFS transporter [Thermoanaerobaculia bacterium]
MTLGWVSFLTDVASDMIYPLLPGFLTRTLSAGPAAIGLIEGVAEASASIMKMVSGWWSDRLRRRKPLVLTGYAIAAAARPLVGLATSWVQVLAIRFADRVGKGIRTAPRDALLADLVPPEKRGRAFGLQRAMDNAGAVGGPLLAALLLKFVFEDERPVFLLAAVPGLAAVLLVAWLVREAPRAVSAPEPSPEKRPAPRSPLPGRFWISIAIFVLFTLSNSSDAFLLLKARDSGVAVWQIPLLWAFFHAVKSAAGVPGGALADRIGRVPAISLGWSVYTISYVGFAFVSTASRVWPLFAFYALFYALTEGAERALVADLVAPEDRGRAFGAFHAATGLASLPASLLFGLCWKVFGAQAAFLAGAGIALISTGALLVFRRRTETAGEPA